MGAEILQQEFSRGSPEKNAASSHDATIPVGDASCKRLQCELTAHLASLSRRLAFRPFANIRGSSPEDRLLQAIAEVHKVRCHSDGPLVGPECTLYAVWMDGSHVVFTASHDGGVTLSRARNIIDRATTMFSFEAVSWANGFVQIAIDPRHGTKSARL